MIFLSQLKAFMKTLYKRETSKTVTAERFSNIPKRKKISNT